MVLVYRGKKKKKKEKVKRDNMAKKCTFFSFMTIFVDRLLVKTCFFFLFFH